MKKIKYRTIKLFLKGNSPTQITAEIGPETGIVHQIVSTEHFGPEWADAAPINIDLYKWLLNQNWMGNMVQIFKNTCQHTYNYVTKIFSSSRAGFILRLETSYYPRTSMYLSNTVRLSATRRWVAPEVGSLLTESSGRDYWKNKKGHITPTNQGVFATHSWVATLWADASSEAVATGLH